VAKYSEVPALFFHDWPLRVVAFNPVERWLRDAAEEIAEEPDRRISAEGREVSESFQKFFESKVGRNAGSEVDKAKSKSPATRLPRASRARQPIQSPAILSRAPV
jgi:hypothetical protein